MSKYIWPRDLASASRWYLTLLQRSAHGLTLDDLIVLLQTNPKSRKSVQTRLSRLKSAGLIYKSSHQYDSRFRITNEGIKRLEILNFNQLKPITNKWDGYWRIVIYDIPEPTRDARYQIRKLLKELGFIQLQLSVWIHPLPCLKYFKQIQDNYGITAHLHLIETNSFKPPDSITKHFNKLYPALYINKTNSRT